MPIADQFSGLDMKNLIGAPLSAAADASIQLAQSTANFINTVGFDKDGKARTASFKFNKVDPDADGNLVNKEMSTEVPMLAIVPIPNLQVDEVNILFDMEVKQSEQSESANDYGGSFSGGGSILGFKVSVSGSISSHSSNTRSSDNSAKYHVDVSATNHGTPEGLSRVLDMMAANVAPTLVSSTAVDETGKPLTGDKKSKNDALKKLRAEKMQLDAAVNASLNSFNNEIVNFKKAASNLQNKYSITLLTLINAAETDENKKTLSTNLDKVNQNWNDFQKQAKDIITAVAPVFAEDKPVLTSVYKLLSVNETGDVADLSLTAEDPLNLAYKNSIEAAKKYNKLVDDASKKDKEYNDELSRIV